MIFGPKHAMSQISYQDARDIIRTVNRLNLNKDNYELIKTRVRPLINAAFSGRLIEKGTRLFRVNRYPGKKLSTSWFGYPPAEIVTGYQRCNGPGNPRFYCAADKVTALWESRAQVGETVFLSNWSVVKPFYCHSILNPVSMGGASDTITTFFEGKFIQEIGSDFSRQYKVTAAIADVLCDPKMRMHPVDGAPPDDAMNWGLTCISYPSAANQNHQSCFALSTQVADNCLELDYIEQFNLTALTDDSAQFASQDVTSSIDTNGAILWKGAPGQSVVSPKYAGKTILITQEAGEIVMRLDNGSLIPPS